MIDVTDHPTPQDALDAVTGEGDTVYFPAGVYEVTTGLMPKSGTRIVGDGRGSIIQCPAVGWLRTSFFDAGIINIYDAGGTVEDIQIQNICIKGTKTQDNDNTPKLIYTRDANGIELSSSFLEQTAFEGFFQEGVPGFDHRVTNNQVRDVGFPAGAFLGLPAIQMNCRRGVVSDNVLTDVGIGIGATGGKLTVASNVISNPTVIGIQIGDNGPGEGITIANNSLEINSSPDITTNGIFAGAGQEPFEQVITGNNILINGQDGHNPPRGIASVTTKLLSIKNNSIDIAGTGQGIRVDGTADGVTAYYSNNTINIHDIVNANAAGLVGVTLINGHQLFLYSTDNSVIIESSPFEIYAIDYNSDIGGEVAAFIAGDIIVNGLVRVNGMQTLGPNKVPLYSFNPGKTNGAWPPQL